MANIAKSLIDDLERITVAIIQGEFRVRPQPSRYQIFYENEIIWSR